MVLFEFDMIPLWFCLAKTYEFENVCKLVTQKLVTQKFADKSDFLALPLLFVLQLKRYLLRSGRVWFAIRTAVGIFLAIVGEIFVFFDFYNLTFVKQQ